MSDSLVDPLRSKELSVNPTDDERGGDVTMTGDCVTEMGRPCVKVKLEEGYTSSLSGPGNLTIYMITTNSGSMIMKEERSADEGEEVLGTGDGQVTAEEGSGDDIIAEARECPKKEEVEETGQTGLPHKRIKLENISEAEPPNTSNDDLEDPSANASDPLKVTSSLEELTGARDMVPKDGSPDSSRYKADDSMGPDQLEEKPFSCNLCEYRTNRAFRLKEHVRTHTGEKPFKCNKCDSRFGQISTLKRHTRTHTGEKPFVCNLCNKKYRDSGNFKLHMRNHTGERPQSQEDSTDADLELNRTTTARGNDESGILLGQSSLAQSEQKSFLCHLCEYQAINASKLEYHTRNRHRRTHAGKNPFICDICDSRFSRKFDLKRHIWIHTGESPFVCHLCDYRSNRAADLKHHLMTHMGEEPFACTSSESMCSYAGGLQIHVRTHAGERPYACNLCDKKFREAGSLREHMRIHPGGNPGNSKGVTTADDHSGIADVDCKIEEVTSDGSVEPLSDNCSWQIMAPAEEDFATSGGVTVEDVKCSWMKEDFEESADAGPSGGSQITYILDHPTDEEVNIEHLRYPSENANAYSKLSRSLQEPTGADAMLPKDESSVSCRSETDNLMGATQSGEKPHACDICGYRSKRADRLKYHMRTHTGEKPFPCNICDSRFSYNSDLKRHVRTHTGEKPYSCDLCEYKTTRTGLLKSHMKTHINEMPFSCDYCDYRSSTADILQDHVKTHSRDQPEKRVNVQTDEKRFACDLCDYRSSFSNHMKTHRLIHTGEKPFACQFCNYRCRQISSLRSHVRTHTGEKPFACDLCDYRSSEKSNLGHHMKTHTGEKPFTCEFCDYRSNNASNLKTHTRTHTNEKPFVCNVCYVGFREAGTLKRHVRTHAREKT